MKTNTQRSPAQIKGSHRAGIKAKMRSRLGRHARQAWELMQCDPLFLDTETTGLGPASQVIEIAVIDQEGTVVFHSRVRPTIAIEIQAQQTHGICFADLLQAPSWPQVFKSLYPTLKGRTIVAHGADFDSRLMNQTCYAWEIQPPVLNFHCSMKLAARAWGIEKGRIGLARALEQAGIAWQGKPHGAVADALACRDLVRHFADYYEDLQGELEAFRW